MEKLKRVAVHIGLPKTGTTTLQELFFAGHPEIIYLGQTNLWQRHEAQLVLETLLTNRPIEEAMAMLGKLVNQDKVLVVSDEAFSFGEFMQRAESWNLHTNHTEIAQRIKRMFGAADIIMVLRRQDDWLESWYRQGLKTGKYLSKTFKDWLNAEFDQKSRQHLLSLLDYEKLYRTYTDTFSRDRVHVFFYEDYCHDFHLLAKDIALKLGIDAFKAESLVKGQARNVSGNEYAGAPVLLKRMGRSRIGHKLQVWVPSLTSFLRRITTRKHAYPSVMAEEKRAILEIFSGSNCRLLQNLGRPVESLDYHI